MKLRVTLIAVVAALSSAAWAQQSGDHAIHGPDATAQATPALTDGEVRRIDKDARKITIRHGAITNLDMPPMTMVFHVSDAGLLDRLTVGDKVRFAAEKRDGSYFVTRVDKAS